MQFPLYAIGKRHISTYLMGIFLDHIYQGHRGAYFDFSGKTEQLLSRIPPTRIEDVICFFPTDREFPIGFNPIPSLPPAVIVQDLKDAWGYDDLSTPNMSLYLTAAIASLAGHPDGTLLSVAPLLADQRYRNDIKGHISDPFLKGFFYPKWYDVLKDTEQRQATASVINKFATLSLDPTVRNIIGQTKTSFTITDTSILIASFPQELGRENGSFLATLLLSTLPPMLTVLDGGHHVGVSAVQTAIERSQLAFGHQFGAQIKSDALRETLIETAQTLVAFRVGPTDSKRLAPEFDLFDGDTKLHQLGDRTFYESDRHPQKLEPLPDPVTNPEKILNWSREKYGSPRAHVEAKINRFLVDEESTTGANSRKRKRKAQQP